jgi:phosphohistidine phosphatase
MNETSPHRLVVMRHSKTEQHASSDRLRQLTDRGRGDAAAAGQWLAREGHRPDRILVSSAVRAQETAHVVGETVGAPEIEVLEELYSADAAEVIALVTERLGESASTAMVIGHNPTMEELASLLQGDEAREVRMPTSGLAVFDCGEGPWSALEAGRASVVASYNPRG